MKKAAITAVSTRKFLTAVLVILILVGIGGFYYGMQLVRSYAVEVSHDVADASASGKNIEKLQDLKKLIDEREALIQKADGIFASEANYQSQALTDVQKYASTYGLKILNTNFEAIDTTKQTTTVGHNFSITLQTPVDYAKFLQFLDAVEGNLPKMQIAKIEVGRVAVPKANQIAVSNITLTIATR